MKRLAIILFFLCAVIPSVSAVDTVFVKMPQLPVLLDKQDNMLCFMRMEADAGDRLSEVVLQLEGDLKDLSRVKLYYSGVQSHLRKGHWATAGYVPLTRGASANESYSVLLSEKKVGKDGKVSFSVDKQLPEGENVFWISVKTSPGADLNTRFSASVESVGVSGKDVSVRTFPDSKVVRRTAVTVRTAGDDGVAAYRIPGLVTTNEGTLLAVYDVRHNSSVDLQEYIEVGLSRSKDGGLTWEDMRIPLSFSGYMGLPDAQNGVGDPSILYDKYTGKVIIAGAWTSGMGNDRAWWGSRQGMESGMTGQLVMTVSDDDGKTWGEPYNITSQIKDESWYFLLQGPGRGMVMRNGTLVFPVQYIDSTKIPNAAIIYSTDGGENWTISSAARSNTTEAQVAELGDGRIMINMRDNRGGSRAVCTTTDMGKTWSEHPTSRKSLIEPVCMASLVSVRPEDNATGGKLLLFSNPADVKDRKNMTLRVSTDRGDTWTDGVLLDEGYSWGYSCVTMIDEDTVGVLYESSAAHIIFQIVELEELLK